MELYVKSSHIELHGYEDPEERYDPLLGLFMIQNYVTGESFFKGIDYDCNNEVLYLPRGMNIEQLEKLTKSKAIYIKDCDPYKETTPNIVKCDPLNEIQKACIRFLLGLEEYNYTKDYSQLAINLRTGVGKTYCVTSYIAMMNIRSIIITSMTSWLQQWEEKILEYTNIESDEIMYLDSNVINRILLDDIDISKVKIFLSTHKALSNWGTSNGWKSVEDLFKKMYVGIHVYDEAHLYFDNMTLIDCHSNSAKTIYITATLERSSIGENRVFQSYFENVPKMDLYDPESKRTTYLSIHFTSHPSNLELEKMKNIYGLNKPYYIDYLLNNPYYWKLFHVIVKSIFNKIEGKILILCGTNRGLDKIRKKFEEDYPEFGITGIYNADNSDRSELNNKIIFSNLQIAGTALDIKDLNLVFNAAAPFKSKVTAKQLFGRLDRANNKMNNLLFLDIVDEGIRTLKNYYSYKLGVYECYAIACKQVIYRDDELNNEYRTIGAPYKPLPFRINTNLIDR